MRPKPKSDRLVLIEVLVEAGLTLMAEARTANKLTKLARARLFRNGLMIALLACCPIRLKNFADLEIGRSIVRIKGALWIVLSASETKERRPDERPIPVFLHEAINTYIEVYRPILARNAPPSTALWLQSPYGTPMKYSAVTEVIGETTLSSVGIKVSPHLFRMCAASTAAVYAAATPHLASALLHHAHPTVTDENYNRGSTLAASEAYAAITDSYRRE
jgi:integrase